MAVALRNAAPLKPEILLAQALSEFEAILSDNQKTKYRLYHGQSSPSPDDVMRLTAEIDKDNSRRKSYRCVGPRLTNVLQVVQQFSTAVDVIIGGAQSQMASAIWGILKISLQIASGFSSYFDKLSTLIMNIGRTCPRYQDFGRLYPESTPLQNGLCRYLIAIVQLCERAVLFTRKPFFSQFTSAVTNPFASEFSSLESDLAILANTIREEVSLASGRAQIDETNSNSKFRALTTAFSEKATQEIRRSRERKRMKARTHFLDACSRYNHQTAWKQARKKGTTEWIYANEKYQCWKQTEVSCALWCTGNIGSGKTVVSANIVDDLNLMLPAAIVIYFFCRYDENESLQARTVIGSLARQLLGHLELDFEQMLSTLNNGSLGTDQVLECLQKALASRENAKRCFIIVDGLDECDEKEVGSLLECLQLLIKQSQHTVHVYCSSRPDVIQWASVRLSPKWNLSMSEGDSDIGNYIGAELGICLESGRLRLGDPSIILKIQNALVGGAQGMYLWVAFQIDSISAQETDESILNALQDLPKDLPETYNRILRKVKENSDPQLYRRIFEIVAAAQRPLDLAEIREAISVVPGDTDWQTGRLINDARRVVDRCCSLLVIDEELLTIHFAHHSVKQHLLSVFPDPAIEDFRVDSREADLRLGDICVTYLNFKVFDTQIAKAELSPRNRQIDYPSGILSGSLPRTNFAGKVALKYLKLKGSHAHDIQIRSEEAFNRQGDDMVQVERDFSFLPYARDHWIIHTKCFDLARKECYRLWERLVDGNVKTVLLPWSPEAWLRPNYDLVETVIQCKSNSLLGKLFHVLEAEPFSAAATTRLFELSLQEIPWTDMWMSQIGYMASVVDDQMKVQLALEHGMDINYQTERYGSALQAVAFCGSQKMAELLIEKGADVNAQGGIHGNALQAAAWCGSQKMVELLIEKGADVNAQGGIHGNALQAAAFRGHKALVTLFVEKGADINARGGFYSTALEAAKILPRNKRNEEVVQFLLANGAEDTT